MPTRRPGPPDPTPTSLIRVEPVGPGRFLARVDALPELPFRPDAAGVAWTEAEASGRGSATTGPGTSASSRAPARDRARPES